MVLGTSSQVPTRHRNHNGYLLRWDGEGLLFDPGEGTQRQFVYAQVAPSQVTRVLITHFHGDHCLGMAGMFQRLSLDQIPHTLHVYYPASGEKYLERLRYASIYHDRLTVEYHPIQSSGQIESTEAFSIHAERLDHGVETYGYRIQEPDRTRFRKEALRELGLEGPKVGQLLKRGSIEHQGRTLSLEEVSEVTPGDRFAFVMDTRECEGTRRLAKKADLLVCESTFLHSEVRMARDYGHLTAHQAAEIARDAEAKNLLLAHFSQRYRRIQDFVEEAQAIFPQSLAARDLHRLPFPRGGSSILDEGAGLERISIAQPIKQTKPRARPDPEGPPEAPLCPKEQDSRA